MQTPAFSLAELLRDQAATRPEAPAILSLQSPALDYAGLWQQVQQTAATLRLAGLPSAARVAVVLPNGPQMALAFLCVASCATCAPLNPNFTAAEFRFFLEDCGVRAVLLHRDEQGPVRAVATGMGLILLEIESCGTAAGQFRIVAGTAPAARALTFSAPSDTALLLHTSGTTARPKMVPLTQAQLLTSARNISNHLALTQADRCLNVMPLFHIHGLVAALLASISAGAGVVCTPGFDDLAFFDWIAQQQPSWTSAVPTMHQAWLARAELYRQKAPGHRFRFVRSSSAALSPQTLQALQALTGAPVIEAYGMTEASHQMASNPLPPGLCKPGSVGLPAGAAIALMNEAGQLLERGAIGEIVVRGPGLTSGYENNPEANVAAFQQGWFRTGDQGRIDDDGYLFITGRLKEIVNRGGEKISPREVDEALLEHPDVLQAVAYAVPHPSLGEDLAAAVVLRADAVVDESTLRGFLFERLASHKVPSTILRVDAIPKGATGKIQRKHLHALLAPLGVQDFAPARGAVESGLATIFSEVLALAQPGANANFFTLGGDSLKGAQVLARINRHFGVELPVTALFRHPTVRALASEVERALPQREAAQLAPGHEPVTAAAERCAPVTPNQRGLWLLARLAPQSAAYNMARTATLRGPLDVSTLQNALRALVQRHEVFRTRFVDSDDEPQQIIAPEIGFTLQVVDLSALALDQQQTQAEHLVRQQARWPIALDHCPLLRATLLRLGEQEHRLVLCLHHIISDDQSLGILWRELAALYGALRAGQPSPLAALPMQFAAHATRLREGLSGDAARQQLDYWKKTLAQLPALLLPTDRSRPLQPSYRGQRLRFSLDPELTHRIGVLSRARGTTVFTTLLAALQVLLYRHSGQEDFAIGVPVLGRSDPKLLGLIGYFVNMLVIRADLSGAPGFSDFLARVQASTTAAYEHQDVPFDVLVKELTQSRDPSRNPLFQVSFTKWSPENRLLRLAGLEPAEIQAIETGAAQFDLVITVVEQRGQLDFSIEYASDLFDAATMERMAGHFTTLLEGIVVKPETPIAQLPVLTPAEQHQLLVQWNDTAADYPRDRCIHQLFEAQAARTPEAVALVFQNQQLRYGELNARANQLAHQLLGLGLAPEALVGICLERSLELVVGLLGIFKAGAAYLPLDPSYPKERLAFMLTDSGAALLLTQQGLLEQLPAHEGRVLCLDQDWPAISAQPNTPAPCHAGAKNLAYVIYTSGSTGTPKGVMIEHRSLLNYVLWLQREFPLAASDRVLQNTPISFDISILELFWPLLAGASLVLAAPAAQRSPDELVDLLRRGSITVLQLVPSMLGVIVEAAGFAALASLRRVFTAGEALGADLVRRFQSQSTAELVNGYGPTETTVYSIFWRCKPAHGREVVPIGRPLSNTRVWILDARGAPVPVGVAGEVFLAGDGVARGYLGRADLTAQRFLPDPFSAVADARMYRTGDLARYLDDGNIEFLGRVDEQFKLRGFRIEPGEIEAVLAGHASVRKAVVIVREDRPGDRRLVAYLVPAEALPLDREALRASLQKRLPEHMRPTAYVVLERLPLLPNGKIDRKALPAPLDDRDTLTTVFVAPRDAREELIALVWCEVLHLERVGVHDNFFELGGHSLLATKVTARLARLLKVELPLRAFFGAPTVSALSAEIAKRLEALPALAATPIGAPQNARISPLSFAQESLWFLDQLSPGGSAYNEPLVLRMSGALNVPALRSAFEVLIERHESLRTRFSMIEGEMAQIIDVAGPVQLAEHNLDVPGVSNTETRAHELVQEEVDRPFDLQRGPLLHLALIRLTECEHVLVINLHHIVTDNWSANLLLGELQTLYGAFCGRRTNPLAPLALQYVDFVRWQRKRVQGARLDELTRYWSEKLEGLEPLSLPVDRPRPARPSYRGAAEVRVIPVESLRPLKALAVRHKATLFMLLLSALQLLLMRLTGQEDVAIGSPIAGRDHAEFDDLIGLFLNVVVLRTDLSGDPTFEQLLARVRLTALDAYDHQEMPFDRLVATLNPTRELNHHPLFNVMINQIDSAPLQLDLPGLVVRPLTLKSLPAKFALTLYVRAREEGIDLNLAYQTDLFSKAWAACMLDQLVGLLGQIAAAPQQRIQAYSLITPAARAWLPDPHAVLDTPLQPSVVEQVLAWASRSPDQVAVRSADRQWTYAELVARATALAKTLRSHGLGRGDVAGIMAARGFGMVGAMLAVLMSGAAFLTIDPDLPVRRRRAMLGEARAKALCLIGQAADAGQELELDAGVAQLPLDFNLLPQSGLAGDTDPAVTLPLPLGDDPAYVFFTSGSSGQPKGILGCHKGLSHFLQWQREQFAIAPTDQVSQLIGLSFDPLLRDVFLPLSSGATLCVPAQGDLIDTISWLAREGMTVVHTTPTVMQSWLRDDDCKTELSRLRWLFISGEPLTDVLVNRWRSQFPGPARLVNLYGPTETTMARCFYPIPALVEPGIQAVGTALPQSQALVLNNAGVLCGIGETGEIVLRTPFRSLGYLNLTEKNKRSFRPNPFRGDPADIVYFTGDQGRYRPDGVMEIAGRVDDQVKIRGVRVEPGEVIANLMRHQTIRECTVVAREDRNGQRQLVAYIVCKPGHDTDATELRAHLQQWLPEACVPAAFVILTALPQLPNGKIDRRALPAPPDDRSVVTTVFVPPRNAREELIAEVWRELLRLERVGVHDNFFELGGHSLLAAQVVARLAKLLKVDLPLRTFFEAATVSSLSAEVDKRLGAAKGDEAIPIQQIPRNVNLPLSFAQQRLWLLDRLLPDKATYNISSAWRLQGALDVPALQHSLDALVARHETLRTRIAISEGEPVQRIDPPRTVALPLTDLSAMPLAEREARAQQMADEHAIQPFDLEAGPVLRLQLLRCSADQHLLLLNVHHIASDGWSMGVFHRELALAYGAFAAGRQPAWAALPIQYADYAIWQRKWLQGEVFERQISYWKAQLADLSVLELPTDRARPALQSYRGARAAFELPKPLMLGLKALGRREGATLFMTLLAAFQVLLARYSSQEDIAVGAPIAGRGRTELEGLVGFFVNTLVLRSDLSGNPRFSHLLARVRETALDAYVHQDLPFERLVEELKPERDLSRNPLIQVMLVLQNTPDIALALPGLETNRLPLERHSAKFDLTLVLTEGRTGLHGELEYSTDLFDAATMERMAGHYQTLLEGIVANPETPIAQLPLLTAAERHRLLVQWNDTAADYPRDRCIHQLFEEQVARTPEAVALVYEDQQLSYRELNARANQLAHHLIGLGVAPEVLVGICLERSLELIVGLLGILKAGGAYVPLDPNYPKERLAFMLTDTRAPVLLTQQRLLAQLPAYEGRILCLDRDWPTIGMHSPDGAFQTFSSSSASTDSAYLIYTSGSTGVPKGVIGIHQGIVNRLSWMWKSIPFGPSEIFCQKTSLSFGDSICEIFGPLLKGFPLIVVSDECARDPRRLVELLAARQVTRIVVVPALLSTLLEAFDDLPDQVPKLTIWMTSGEALVPELLARFRKRLPRCRLINLYGASEVSADVTCCDTGSIANGSIIPIGRPIFNTQIYILNQGEPVPAGVAGELCVGGVGLARGYLNRPELTVEKFPPDPFSTVPGARMYRTGDLARYLPDGNIEYLGRIDDQVKIHGFRIELGEIEEVLRQHPAVRSAAVQDRDTDSGDKELVAFIVNQQNMSVSGPELRDFLGRRLPRHLIPGRMFLGNSLPLSANGKLDRAALKSTALPKGPVQTTQQPPYDALQTLLLQIWSGLLGPAKIGINDNFFDLGGNSLKAVIMLSRVEKLTGWSVPLSAIYNHPTVKFLARALLEHKGKGDRSPLVQIQAGTAGPPFFFMHGDMHGGGFYCYQLARAMGPDQAFYVVQPHGLPGRPLPLSIEEMATEYLALIRASFPHGPYFLGGHCNGALVAFEMAQQLSSSGSRVELLVMMDPPVARGHLSALAAEVRPGTPSRADQEIGVGELDNLPPEARHSKIMQLYSDVCQSYDSKFYGGRLTLFLANEVLHVHDPARGWDRMAATTEIHVVPGGHVTMITAHIATLAKKLTECRDKIKWD